VIDPDEDELIQLTFDLRQVWRGDWNGAILIVMRRGPMQFHEIRDEMKTCKFDDPWIGSKRTLSPSEVSRSLTRMTKDGWLIRTETPAPQMRSTVTYELSPEGRNFVDTVVSPALEWCRQNPRFFAHALRNRGRRRAADERDTRADRIAPAGRAALCAHGEAGRD
jgi:DNA-binding HxlR family transcriptional regulator